MAAPLAMNESAQRVFDVIWRHGPIARVDIGPKVRLSAMSVTRVTKDLAERGLLVEDVQRDGSRGQPSRPLMVKPDAAFAAGVYFSHGAIHLGLINLAGEILAETSLATPVDTPSKVADAAQTHIASWLDTLPVRKSAFVGVGFAVPGDFISDRQRINAHAMFPGFGGTDLAEALQAGLSFPVFIENDAASAALGERLLGVGQSLDNFFFAHIGHGIGGGIVIDGRLRRGARGNAGIIGVQFPNDKPRPSGQDLFAHLKASGVAATDFSELEALRPQSCPPLKAWIKRAADQLREALWITARLLDPEAIIIGGRLPMHLLQEIVARIDDETFCSEGVGLPRPKLLASSLGPRAGVIGAATVPFVETFFTGSD